MGCAKECVRDVRRDGGAEEDERGGSDWCAQNGGKEEGEERRLSFRQ